MNFDEWVDYVFNHEVTEPQWWFQEAYEDQRSLDPVNFIEYGTRLFRESGEVLAKYSDGQVDHGLWYIISPGNSDEIFALKNETIELDRRVDLVAQIFSLYHDTFEPRCTPHLSHLDHVSKGTPEHVSPLNSICYVWWDIFILWGDPDDPSVEPLNRACLSVMEKTLELPNIATLEGALHGLGHFAPYYPADCGRIIDKFLQARKSIPEELRQYALAARKGGVL
jgi:hypothetical protein